MVSIAAVTPQVVSSYSQTPVDVSNVQGSDSRAQSGVATSSATINVQTLAGSGKAGGIGGSSESSDSSDSQDPTVKALKEQIAKLQKQLQELQQRLQQVETSNQDEQTKTITETTLQAQIVTLNASIQQAYGQLFEALKSGGSGSSGNMVSATA